MRQPPYWALTIAITTFTSFWTDASMPRCGGLHDFATAPALFAVASQLGVQGDLAAGEFPGLWRGLQQWLVEPC
jgi:hypothetical protein